MNITVDSREPPKIIKQARKHFDNVEIETLPCSDFCYGRVGIERKTIQDFAGSIRDGRVFTQAESMVQSFDRPFIIIVGSHKRLYNNPRYKWFTANVYRGALASLRGRTGINCYTVANHTKFFEEVKLLFEKGNKESRELNEIKRVSPHSDDYYINAVGALPGIGLKKAEAILKSFQMKELFNATEKDLQTVKGIGKTHANTIKKYYK
jgi:ERCC4-type nuclease